MRIKKLGGWFRQRHYPHFDYPIGYETAKQFACVPSNVARHSFLPLIGYTDSRRTFKTDNSNKAIVRRKRPRKVGVKAREIKYAAHRDAAIYAFYAYKLQLQYEDWLGRNDLQRAVLGYRSGLGSNVDMAADAFAEISARGQCTVMCFDISDFFPSISHFELKCALREVLQTEELTLDWFNVFKSIVRHNWVDLKQISIPLGFKPTDPPSPLVDDIGPALETLRGAKLIHSNSMKRNGIPQGLPISAVFANVAMAEFDKKIQAWVAANDASYRRYSDDIMIICNPDAEADAEHVVTRAAGSHSGLVINPDKTEVSRFTHHQGDLAVDKPVTYLGFTFDGQRVLLRARTLSRYYRRMTYAVRGTIRGAARKGQPAHKAYRRKLYRDISHLGKQNFYSYASRADKKFVNSGVKRQLRNHFKILLRKLANRGR
ncbi:antiviral reverse transcriptase Drt2 [Sphingomicrobium sp. XHP0239]|uniref:antiviral reverse transcriptase Drt2 n=1 Tax=Sphingomicrobium maritimum TaxID=3133972 RepID=UPI0031CCA3F4